MVTSIGSGSPSTNVCYEVWPFIMFFVRINVLLKWKAQGVRFRNCSLRILCYVIGEKLILNLVLDMEKKVFICGVLKKCTAGGTICSRSKEINNFMHLSKSAFFNLWVAIMFWMGHEKWFACWFYNVNLYAYFIESLKCHIPYAIYLFILIAHLFLYLTSGVARKANGLIKVVALKCWHTPTHTGILNFFFCFVSS